MYRMDWMIYMFIQSIAWPSLQRHYDDGGRSQLLEDSCLKTAASTVASTVAKDAGCEDMACCTRLRNVFIMSSQPQYMNNDQIMNI